MKFWGISVTLEMHFSESLILIKCQADNEAGRGA